MAALIPAFASAFLEFLPVQSAPAEAALIRNPAVGLLKSSRTRWARNRSKTCSESRTARRFCVATWIARFVPPAISSVVVQILTFRVPARILCSCEFRLQLMLQLDSKGKCAAIDLARSSPDPLCRS